MARGERPGTDEGPPAPVQPAGRERSSPARGDWSNVGRSLRAEAGNRLNTLLRAGFRTGLDWVLPSRCAATGGAALSPHGLSPEGWSALQFIDAPFCRRCARPFDWDYGDNAECPECIAEPPAFDEARAAVVYDATSHDLIVGFKHGDRTERAPLFARWLVRAGASLLTPDAILIPTPLHRDRLRYRRFNQSVEIARSLARLTGCAMVPDALVRVRATVSQQGLTADQRRRNLSGAIALSPGAADKLARRPVVLIDDVLTTGATLSACARAARRAGPSRLSALVVARVVKEGENAI